MVGQFGEEKRGHFTRNIHFLSNLEFSRLYLSLYYPFTSEQVIAFGKYLVWGDAFYAEYRSEDVTALIPSVGLSFNKNVLWEPGLKKLWTAGKWNDATEEFELQNDASNELYSIIPLDLQKGFEIEEGCYMQSAIDTGEYNEYRNGIIDKEHLGGVLYPRLTDKGFLKLYRRKKTVILYNDTIWQNTLCKVITEPFMQVLIDKIIQELGAGKECPAALPKPKGYRVISVDYDVDKYMQEIEGRAVESDSLHGNSTDSKDLLGYPQSPHVEKEVILGYHEDDMPFLAV